MTDLLIAPVFDVVNLAAMGDDLRRRLERTWNLQHEFYGLPCWVGNAILMRQRQQNGVWQVFAMCRSCGKTATGQLPFRLFDDIMEIPEVGRMERIRIGESAYLIPPAMPEIWEIDYHEYLRSPEWQRRAYETKARAGWHCQVCNVFGTLHAHHRTYKHLGDERPEELLAICPTCHELIHGVGSGVDESRAKSNYDQH